MAKATEFTPALMEEVATGRRVKRGMYDKLPSRRATPGQIRRVKHEIRVRYAARYGDAPPPVVEPAELQRKNKEERLRARGQAKLTVTLPIELRAHVTVECARAGLTLDEGVQAALEARFPRGCASSPPTPLPAA